MDSIFGFWSDSHQRALENWKLDLAILKGQCDFDNEVWTWKSLVDRFRKSLNVAQSSSFSEQTTSSNLGFDNPSSLHGWYPGPMKTTEGGWLPIGQSVLILDFECSHPDGLRSFLSDKSSFSGVAWCLYPVVDGTTGKAVVRLISPFAETVSAEVSLDAHRFLSADLEEYAEEDAHVPILQEFGPSQKLDWPQVQGGKDGFFYDHSGPVIFADMFSGSDPDDGEEDMLVAR